MVWILPVSASLVNSVLPVFFTGRIEPDGTVKQPSPPVASLFAATYTM